MSEEISFVPFTNGWIRQERLRRGWSQNTLADKLGSTRITVSRWESGSSFPNPYFRQQLSALFDVPIARTHYTSPEDVVQEARTDPQPILQEQDSSDIEEVSAAQPVQQLVASTSSPTLQSSLTSNVAGVGDVNRQRMLTKVYTFWINGVFERSLKDLPLLDLEMRIVNDAVFDSWQQILPSREHEAVTGVQLTDIERLYEEAGGELLLLGEPGSGKTTLLLKLARHLLNRAEQDVSQPIPVVFHLAAWAQRQPPLDKWLVEELTSRYQVPHSLAQEWISDNRVLPLLDGLDEIPLKGYSICIQAINAYRQTHGLHPFVVCSRNDVYFQQAERLVLHRAVMIQPVITVQVVETLVQAGKTFGPFLAAFEGNPELQEMVTTPLMLQVLLHVYQEGDPAVLKAFHLQEEQENLNSSVFATYVQRMLSRRSTRALYAPEQTMKWLTSLACNMRQHQQGVFYLESLQWNWLPTEWTRWLYLFIETLFFNVLLGALLCFCLTFAMFTTRVFASLPFCMLILISGGVIGG